MPSLKFKVNIRWARTAGKQKKRKKVQIFLKYFAKLWRKSHFSFTCKSKPAGIGEFEPTRHTQSTVEQFVREEEIFPRIQSKNERAERGIEWKCEKKFPQFSRLQSAFPQLSAVFMLCFHSVSFGAWSRQVTLRRPSLKWTEQKKKGEVKVRSAENIYLCVSLWLLLGKGRLNNL